MVPFSSRKGFRFVTTMILLLTKFAIVDPVSNQKFSFYWSLALESKGPRDYNSHSDTVGSLQPSDVASVISNTLFRLQFHLSEFEEKEVKE